MKLWNLKFILQIKKFLNGRIKNIEPNLAFLKDKS